MLVSAWDVLSTQTIANCFRKSGISTESQEIAIAEDDNPFRELQDKIGDLRSVQPNFIEEDFDATTFADVDAEVKAVQPPPSDAEIVAELLEMEGVSDDDDYYSIEVVDKSVKYPDKISCCKLSRLCRCSLYFKTRGTQSNPALVPLKVKSISILLRRSKRPLGTF